MKGIQHEEYLRLLAHVKGNASGRRYRGLLDLMYDAGLRISEATHIQPGDYEPRSGNPHLWVRRGKGNKERHVPISDDHAARIEAWLADPARPVGPTFALYPRLSGEKRGQPVQDTQLREYLAEISRKAQVVMFDRNGDAKPVSPHKLRHSYAHRLLLKGLSLPEVKEQLGHASITTTQIYLKVDDQVRASRVRDALDGRHVNEQVQEQSEARADLRLSGGRRDDAGSRIDRAMRKAVADLSPEELKAALEFLDSRSADDDQEAA